jgi:hypothetical protein
MRARPLPVLVALICLALGSCAQTAAGASPSSIEQVWSFNGGEVAIHPGPGGTLVGTVIQPTQFAQCSHPVGEEMWSDMRLQPDGSYWGLHQWFFETAACVPNKDLGPTAWRVMEAAGGAHYLLVCLSPPGGPQPTIAANGAEANVNYGCRESARIAPVPVQAPPESRAGQASFAQAVTLPSNRKCYSRRTFQIHLKDPKYDPLKEVLVTIGRRKVRVTRHGKLFVATINLKGLPRGTFTVKIRATTVLGHHLTGSRTYHTCVPKRTKHNKPARKSSHR